MNLALLSDAFSVFLGIIIEAIPFILLGSIVSALLGRYLTPKRLQKMLPNNRIGKSLSMSLTGMFFPVCECGNVPVAKRFLLSGVGSGASVSFLLGAPILNPVVIITTIIAFPGTPEMWWGRIIGGLLIATITGYLLSFIVNTKESSASLKSGGHDHHGCDHKESRGLASLVDSISSEFVMMTSVMVVGATIAACMQTFIPRETLLLLSGGPLGGILTMMLLAFIVSICSTTDAFFSLAYTHIFSPSALLAFLVFGPMVDIKSLLMMRTIYSNRFLLAMVAIIIPQVIGWALLFHFFVF